MVTAVQFLTVLEEKDLLPKDLLIKLYKQVAQSPQPVVAAEIIEMLTEKGFLTPVLANRLLVALEEKLASEPGPAQEGKEEDIGFAPLKEEKEPRPVIGKHRPYKSGDSGKGLGSAPPAPKTAKPVEPPPPKSLLTDKPPPSRWATSAYDREIDTSKGIVSPRLVQMAGVEKIPEKLVLHRKTQWLTMIIYGGILLGLAVIIFLLVELFLRG